jgi:hypothetical protein
MFSVCMLITLVSEYGNDANRHDGKKAQKNFLRKFSGKSGSPKGCLELISEPATAETGGKLCKLCKIFGGLAHGRILRTFVVLYITFVYSVCTQGSRIECHLQSMLSTMLYKYNPDDVKPPLLSLHSNNHS